MVTKTKTSTDRGKGKGDRLVGGVALILIGLIAPLSQIGHFYNWGLFVLPTMSIVFLTGAY